MTMSPDRIQPWRWFVKSALVVGAFGTPFLRVTGQSAFRFDVPTLKLLVFGSAVSMDQFFLVLIVILFLSFLAVFLTILFGRIWCGWLCPQTVVVEFTGFIDGLARRGGRSRFLAIAALMAISIVLAADILWYFVEPRQFAMDLLAGTLGRVERWSWAILSVVTFLNFLFLRRTFCATVCPYAKLQGAIFDDRTLVIAADTDRMKLCMHCDACVAACPVGIDVRKGLQSECVSCALCIDACAGRMRKRGLPSLIGYRFGTLPGGGFLRRSVVLSGSVTALFLLLFVVTLLSAVPIDMEISADPAFPPVRQNDTIVQNSFVLSLTNRTDAAQSLTLSAEGAAGPIEVVPETIVLQKGEHRTTRLALTAVGASRLRSGPEEVVVKAVARGLPSLLLERKAVLLQPW